MHHFVPYGMDHLRELPESLLEHYSWNVASLLMEAAFGVHGFIAQLHLHCSDIDQDFSSTVLSSI